MHWEMVKVQGLMGKLWCGCSLPEPAALMTTRVLQYNQLPGPIVWKILALGYAVKYTSKYILKLILGRREEKLFFLDQN